MKIFKNYSFTAKRLLIYFLFLLVGIYIFLEFYLLKGDDLPRLRAVFSTIFTAGAFLFMIIYNIIQNDEDRERDIKKIEEEK